MTDDPDDNLDIPAFLRRYPDELKSEPNVEPSENIPEQGRLPEICSPSQAGRYKGLMRPRCCGGTGCRACWAKYGQNRGWAPCSRSLPALPDNTPAELRGVLPGR